MDPKVVEHRQLVRQLILDVGTFSGPELLPLAIAVMEAGMVEDGLLLARRAILPACGSWGDLRDNGGEWHGA